MPNENRPPDENARKYLDDRLERLFAPTYLEPVLRDFADQIDAMALDLMPEDPWYVRLRKVRHAKGLEVKDAAEKVSERLTDQNKKLSVHTMKKHEEGKRSPGSAVRAAYAALYGVSEKVLFPPAK